MTLDFNPDRKLTLNRFSKLGAWYIFALSIIATVSIVGQILIQNHLRDQLNDSRVVNLAGSQRYKSQWIVKTVLLLYADVDHDNDSEKVNVLAEQVDQWKDAHYGLQNGSIALDLPGVNSETVMKMFREMEPYFLDLHKSASHIIQIILIILTFLHPFGDALLR